MVLFGLRIVRLMLALTSLIVVSMPASADAMEIGAPLLVRYGAQEADTAEVYAGGPVPLLLMHEKGYKASSIHGPAERFRAEGFTVFNLEWVEYKGKEGLWAYDTGQIEAAVRYVRDHAASFGIDPDAVTMVGGSRGANLALLTAQNMDAVQPGTVKAIAALSGNVNPQQELERAKAGELAKGVLGDLASAYGCKKDNRTGEITCDEAYIREWSPLEKASSTNPAMFLAASLAERKTANSEDVEEMDGRLAELHVPATAATPPTGHGFAYFHEIRTQLIAFLRG